MPTRTLPRSYFEDNEKNSYIDIAHLASLRSVEDTFRDIQTPLPLSEYKHVTLFKYVFHLIEFGLQKDDILQ